MAAATPGHPTLFQFSEEDDRRSRQEDRKRRQEVRERRAARARFFHLATGCRDHWNDTEHRDRYAWAVGEVERDLALRLGSSGSFSSGPELEAAVRVILN